MLVYLFRIHSESFILVTSDVLFARERWQNQNEGNLSVNLHCASGGGAVYSRYRYDTTVIYRKDMI